MFSMCPVRKYKDSRDGKTEQDKTAVGNHKGIEKIFR